MELLRGWQEGEPADVVTLPEEKREHLPFTAITRHL
jgi:hypothetical protein